MLSIKQIFISLVIFIIIVGAAFQWIISPVLREKNAIDEKEKLLMMLQRKTDQMTDMIQHNAKYSMLLQYNIQMNTSLTFLQKRLNVSRLLIESLKITNSQEHDEISVTLRGDYRHLLEFLALLAKRPNGMQIVALKLKKNQMIFSIRTQRKAESDIMPASSTLQSLGRYHWRCVGDVRRAGHLLGVFLAAQGKSHYFGLGLSWQNSDWKVVDLSPSAVTFQSGRNQQYWQLAYHENAL